MVVLALVLVLVQVLVVVLALALVLVLVLVCLYTGTGTCLWRLQCSAALQRSGSAAVRCLAELQQPLAAPKGDDSPSPEVEIQGGGLGDIESS